MRRRAFSLLEGLLVVAIVALLSAVAVPRYSRFTAQQRLESATRRVLLDLARTKRGAQLASASRQMSFFPGTESYSQTGVADMNHPGETATVRLDEEPYGAELVSALFGGDSVVVFNAYGTPDSGGTIVIRVGALQQTITVDGPTGRFSKLLTLVE
jgi:type II secretory pathway pseudopilin PulG